jgi:WD40 repeat protein
MGELQSRRGSGHLGRYQYSLRTLLFFVVFACLFLSWLRLIPEASRRFDLANAFVSHATFSHDGTLLVTGLYGGPTTIWEVETGRAHRIFWQSKYASPVALSPDQGTLAVAYDQRADGTVELWDPKTTRKVKVLHPHATEVTCLALSSDGALLASGSTDRTIKVTNTRARKEPVTLAANIDRPSCIAFSPDDEFVAAGITGGTVYLWRLETGGRPRTFEGYSPPQVLVSFSPDGKLLATAGAEGTVKLWDVRSGKLHDTVPLASAAGSLAFSPDGSSLAIGQFKGSPVTLWDVAARKKLATGPNNCRPWPIAFSAKGKLVVATKDKDTLCLWEPVSGEQRLVGLQKSRPFYTSCLQLLVLVLLALIVIIALAPRRRAPRRPGRE